MSIWLLNNEDTLKGGKNCEGLLCGDLLVLFVKMANDCKIIV